MALWYSIYSWASLCIPFYLKWSLPLSRRIFHEVPGAPRLMFDKRTNFFRDLGIVLGYPCYLWNLFYSILGWPPFIPTAPRSELHFNLTNLCDAVFLLFMSVVGGLMMLLSLCPILCAIYPLWVYMLYKTTNYIKTRRQKHVPHSQSNQRTERWFYINGMMNTLNTAELGRQRLHDMFKTDPQLLYNPTEGFFADFILCILGRTFDWPTVVSRLALEEIESAIVDDEVTKVVLIGHSQGCIISSNILQLIAAKMHTNANPNLTLERLQKFEVYLLASPADEIYFKYGPRDPFQPGPRLRAPPSEDDDSAPSSSPSAPRPKKRGQPRDRDPRAHPPTYANSAVYIESFGNGDDFVARFGCLHPKITQTPAEQEFVFTFDRHGHVMNEHYNNQRLSNYSNPSGAQSHLQNYL